MVPHATIVSDRKRAAAIAAAMLVGGLLVTAVLVVLGVGAYAPAVIAAGAVGAAVWILLRIMRHLQEGAVAHYEQAEALAGLYATLPIRTPLPAMRGHVMSPDFAREIVSGTLSKRPKTVVELGSGVSTVLTAYALEVIGDESAHIYSLDHEPLYASITRNNLAAHGLEKWATIIDAPLVETKVDGSTRRWYDTSQLLASIEAREIDLLVVDGPPARDDKMAREPALPVLQHKLSARALVMVDDAGRAGEREIVRRWTAGTQKYEVRWPNAEKGAAILKRV